MIDPSNLYFFLSEQKSLVRGAKKSIILDFKNDEIYNLDRMLSDILQLGEGNYRFIDAVNKIGGNDEKTLTQLIELEKKGLIYFTSKKRKVLGENEISPELTFLWIEITGRCNLHCSHCYIDPKKGGNNSSLDLSTEKIKQVLDQASEIGCNALQLTGGEPTLHKDLKELIKYANDLGFFIEVFTNSTMLSGSLLNFFQRQHVRVATSFYSYKKEVHDSITGVAGSYERSLRAIKSLVEKGIDHRCEVTRMEANNSDFTETIHFLDELGVSNYREEYVLPIGRGEKLGRGTYSSFNLCAGEKPSTIPLREYRKRLQWNGCWFGKAAVCHNGDVLPCIFAREHVAGNVFRDSLKSIVYGGLLNYWRINKDNVETCKDCEYRYHCYDCPPLTYSLTKRLDRKPPFCPYDPYTGKWAVLSP